MEKPNLSKREKVFFSASALTLATGLSAAAFKLIQKHRLNGDAILLEDFDEEQAAALGSEVVHDHDGRIDLAEIVYLGSEDDPHRGDHAREVNLIISQSRLERIKHLAKSGHIYITDKFQKDSSNE